MKREGVYFLVPLSVFAVLAIGGSISQAGMAWYRTLTLPAYIPPGWVFSVVWNTIGVLTAGALMLFYRTVSDVAVQDRWYVTLLCIANALLYIGWTVLFFSWHAIGLSWFAALGLEMTLVELIRTLYVTHKRAALLLVPYAAWVAFALMMNAHIWFLNRAIG